MNVTEGFAQARTARSSVSPIYKPIKRLIDIAVVVVANLAPAKIRGVESRGMLLAADLDGAAVLLTPDKEVPAGSKVR